MLLSPLTSLTRQTLHWTGVFLIHSSHKMSYIKQQSEADPSYNSVREGKADIIQPKSVFYNQVQEFNRDLTVALISQFAYEHCSKAEQSRCEQKKEMSKFSGKDASSNEPENMDQSTSDSATCDSDTVLIAGKTYDHGISILEGLAASGLRSIRFGLEIPGLKRIVANDFDKGAVEVIEKNIKKNNVEHIVSASFGDAAMVMYESKSSKDLFDVIDLDPYGSGCQFFDAAVQAVAEGGMLCITATDMAVLCGNTPETCRSKYGSMSYRSAYCKEMALRILLQCIETRANVYSRYIIPVLSISADFYIRVFVKVYSSASMVRQSSAKLGRIYHCSGCGSFTIQRLAKKIPTKGVNFKMAHTSGPPVSERCEHCDHKHYVAGPIWTDPIHDVEFVGKVIESVEKNKTSFGTHKRILGMLSMVKEELDDCPMYYVLDELAQILHIMTVPIKIFKSALLNAGFKVSMSHAAKGTVKTNACNRVIWDIMRAWEKKNPVAKKRLEPGSVTANILSKETVLNVSFDIHPDSNIGAAKKGHVRFQENPEKYWGPKSRAKKSNISQTLGAEEMMADKRKQNQGKRKQTDHDKSDEEDAKRKPDTEVS